MKFFLTRVRKVFHLESNSFSVVFVLNASFDCYPNNSMSPFTNFFPEHINLEKEYAVSTTELSYPSLYQTVRKKFFYLDEATPDTKLSDNYKPNPALYPTMSDIVNEIMRKLLRNVKRIKKPIGLRVTHQQHYTASFVESSQRELFIYTFQCGSLSCLWM